MTSTFIPTWDLDRLFEGGSSSVSFQKFLEEIEHEVELFEKQVNNFDPEATDLETKQAFANLIASFEQIQIKAREASAFISCLHAQNVHDSGAHILVGRRNDLQAAIAIARTKLDQQIVKIPTPTWEAILQSEDLKEVSFVLQEYRDLASEKMDEEQEVLMNDLAVDGYHGWSQMYDAIVGSMEVQLEEDGELVTYSVGQAANKGNHPDRNVRKHVAQTLQQAWQEKAPLFAQTLNHLAGFRLQTYKHRGWDDVLKEPLMINRMKKETLDAMWNAISNAKKPFVQFLEKKAQLLGIDKLSMYDIGAPLYNVSSNKMEYSEGAQFIIEQFTAFSPKMGDFARHAFEQRWIEAEDRAGKRPGGFCTSFPHSKESRIFMTYSGTASNLATLAHELGHAYHQHIMNELPGLNQRYAMNVAETASTFAEMIVADAAVKNATTKEEKITLLEDKIRRSIAFFMNIHARFIFEQRFYEERKKGLLSVDRLNTLMEEAQREAYGDATADTDPTFWASKLHFHITGVPFYNFPYTFGFLFSLGIYAHASKQDESFEDDYIALLSDTGRMNVEDLAKKHLQVDITKQDFWQQAIQLCIDDVEEFLELI